MQDPEMARRAVTVVEQQRPGRGSSFLIAIGDLASRRPAPEERS